MTIRPYDSADESQVVALWNAALPDSAPHNEPARVIRQKLAVDRELFLVAEDSGRIIGTAMGGYDGHRGWIYSVAVDSSARRQGVGRALLQALERLLGKRGCLKVNLQVRASNAGVVDFYRRLGYTVEERVSMGKRL